MSSLAGRCIFYRTLAIDPHASRGSDLRPAKLLSAFRDLGWEVDVVDGAAAIRRPSVQRVLENIRSGTSYEFLYAEPPTTPVMLNESHHVPTHPLLDYRFLAQCHASGVPVILFYCDVQWRLPQYPAQVGWPKYLAALPFFHLDLAVYRRIVDVLALPDAGMLRVLPRWMSEKRLAVSIPGFDPAEQSPPHARAPGMPLRLFYVGGVLPPVYDLSTLLSGSSSAVAAGVQHTLTICTRPAEWNRRPTSYDRHLGPHVSIVHNRNREELLELYANHDIAVMPYGTLNSDWAMPVKFPEAIGMGLPVLAGEGTAVGRTVAEQGIGWIVGAKDDDLVRVLAAIDDVEFQRASNAVGAVQPRYTWTKRAEEIVEVAETIRSSRERVLGAG